MKILTDLQLNFTIVDDELGVSIPASWVFGESVLLRLSKSQVKYRTLAQRDSVIIEIKENIKEQLKLLLKPLEAERYEA